MVVWRWTCDQIHYFHMNERSLKLKMFLVSGHTCLTNKCHIQYHKYTWTLLINKLSSPILILLVIFNSSCEVVNIQCTGTICTNRERSLQTFGNVTRPTLFNVFIPHFSLLHLGFFSTPAFNMPFSVSIHIQHHHWNVTSTPNKSGHKCKRSYHGWIIWYVLFLYWWPCFLKLFCM